MMVAYGITSQAPWPFYAIALAFHLAFVVIPGGLGAIAAILLANLLPAAAEDGPDRPRRWLAVAGLVYTGVRVWSVPGDTLSSEWMNALIGRLEFSTNRLLPSRWMSAGLIGSAGATGATACSTCWRDRRPRRASPTWPRRSSPATSTGPATAGSWAAGRPAGTSAGTAPTPLFHRLFGFIRQPIRLLILKDLRTFRRDPTQWSQFLIFFGLLAFYFVNIRRLGYDVQNAYFRNLLSFLNLSVTALILSTFTSRFIFPMLSLEGRNLWVLGLFPVRRSSIIWGKFAFSTGISLVATEVLDRAQRPDAPDRRRDARRCTWGWSPCSASGSRRSASASAPGCRTSSEEDPSKIAAGFGGTLNLLVSLAFIALVIGPPAVLCHLYFAGESLDFRLVAEGDPLVAMRPKLVAAGLVSLAVGAVATIVPMRIGIRSFERMEF